MGKGGGAAGEGPGTGGAAGAGAKEASAGTGGAAGGGENGMAGKDAGAGGTPDAGGTPSCEAGVVSGTIAGTAGAWEPILKWPKATKPISGEGLLADPARPGDLYFFYEDYQPNGQPRHVLKSTDFGSSWTQIDKTPVVGNPWGVAIDPNPCRAPATPPTMYTPAGYGDQGIWKSTDGGATWANLFAGHSDGVMPAPGGGTVTFPPDKNGQHTDFYQIHVLPDDPPNHILITYHYQAGGQPAPLGESKDGGATWEVHLLPAGDSHYVFGVDASTWIAIAGDGSGGGTYRTTTAGRSGGQISKAAWTQVDPMEHIHGSFTPWKDTVNGYIYFAVKSGLKRTHDGGATWTSIDSGQLSTLMGTATNIYVEGGDPTVRRAAISNATTWSAATSPVDADGWGGVPPFGAVSVTDGRKWVLLQAMYGRCSNNCQPARSPLLSNGEIWRYVEP
jgi:hypothetical protein